MHEKVKTKEFEPRHHSPGTGPQATPPSAQLPLLGTRAQRLPSVGPRLNSHQQQPGHLSLPCLSTTEPRHNRAAAARHYTSASRRCGLALLFLRVRGRPCCRCPWLRARTEAWAWYEGGDAVLGGCRKARCRVCFWMAWSKSIISCFWMAWSKKWGWKGSGKCCICYTWESIDHLFFHCVLAKLCWSILLGDFQMAGYAKIFEGDSELAHGQGAPSEKTDHVYICTFCLGFIHY